MDDQKRMTRQLLAIDAKIKDLGVQKLALRAEAIESGFAFYQERARSTTPDVKWWKETHPHTWKQFVKQGTSNFFTWNK